MYCTTNYPTKKALREAVKAGKGGGIYQPGPFGGNEPTEGETTVEGPHYPKPHSWYARVWVEGGQITKVIS